MILFSFLVYLSYGLIFAQGDRQEQEELYDMSLSDLLNMKIISAAKKEQSIADAPAIVTVINSKQIQDRGYNSVAEALESVVGLDVISDHFQPNLGVRGVNGGMRSYSRIVKVMIDGQPVSNRSTADNYLDESLIPMYSIERIEVIKGPNSALYGADAYLGVINIITKNGESADNRAFAVGAEVIQGNTGFNGSGVYAGKAGNLDYLITGSLQKSDRSGLVPQDLPGRTKYQSQGNASEEDVSRPITGFGKIQYAKELIGKFNFDFHYQRIDSYGEFQDWGLLTHNNRMSLYNGYCRAKYSKNISDRLNGSVSIAYSQGEPTSDDELNIGTNETFIRETGYTGLDVKSEAVYNVNGNNSLTFGYDFIRDKHTHQTYYRIAESGEKIKNTDYVKENNPPPDDFNNSGAYLQNILNPASLFKVPLPANFNIISGIRFDIHSVYGNEITYRGAFVYKSKEKMYTKLLYGTSFKAPSSTQLYTNYIRTGGVIGNPDLKPEKASIVDWQIAGHVTNRLFLNFDVFFNNTIDKVEISNPPPDQITASNKRAYNQSKINSFGLEGELNYGLENLSGYANYAFQQSKITKKRLDQRDGNEYTFMTNLYPEHMVKFGINRKIPALFLNANLEGKFTGARIASGVNTREADNATYLMDYAQYLEDRYSLNPYFIMDLLLSTHGLEFINNRETEIRFKVCNVLNAEYAYPGYKNDFDIPGFERAYKLSVVQRF